MESKTPAQVGPRGSGTGTQPQTGSSLQEVIYAYYHKLEHISFKCTECGTSFALEDLFAKGSGTMMCPICNQRHADTFQVSVDQYFMEHLL
jgi:DNA-directed RNA polymerase subunit RPC12/RpoP